MNIDSDIRLVSSVKPAFQSNYAASCTRGFIARALVESLWKSGHFRLQDLSLSLVWTLPDGGDGAYEVSVDAASQYIDSLGLLSTCEISDDAGTVSLDVDVLPALQESDELSLPFGTPDFSFGNRTLPDVAAGDVRSWIVYIPFDTSGFFLGGSAYSRVAGLEGVPAPPVSDAAYFVDCFEIVRELIEDGVVLSGRTVGNGGLGCALGSFLRNGADLELGELAMAAGRPDEKSLLFSEVPGVLLQIGDLDFDYLDSQFLLQDVAYFPLGHPASELSDLNINISGRTGIQRILDSLINID